MEIAAQKEKAEKLSTEIESIVEKQAAQRLTMQFMEVKSGLHEVRLFV